MHVDDDEEAVTPLRHWECSVGVFYVYPMYILPHVPHYSFAEIGTSNQGKLLEDPISLCLVGGVNRKIATFMREYKGINKQPQREEEARKESATGTDFPSGEMPSPTEIPASLPPSGERRKSLSPPRHTAARADDFVDNSEPFPPPEAPSGDPPAQPYEVSPLFRNPPVVRGEPTLERGWRSAGGALGDGEEETPGGAIAAEGTPPEAARATAHPPARTHTHEASDGSAVAGGGVLLAFPDPADLDPAATAVWLYDACAGVPSPLPTLQLSRAVLSAIGERDQLKMQSSLIELLGEGEASAEVMKRAGSLRGVCEVDLMAAAAAGPMGLSGHPPASRTHAAASTTAGTGKKKGRRGTQDKVQRGIGCMFLLLLFTSTQIRNLVDFDAYFHHPYDFIVCDVSFISGIALVFAYGMLATKLYAKSARGLKAEQNFWMAWNDLDLETMLDDCGYFWTVEDKHNHRKFTIHRKEGVPQSLPSHAADSTEEEEDAQKTFSSWIRSQVYTLHPRHSLPPAANQIWVPQSEGHQKPPLDWWTIRGLEMGRHLIAKDKSLVSRTDRFGAIAGGIFIRILSYAFLSKMNRKRDTLLGVLLELMFMLVLLYFVKAYNVHCIVPRRDLAHRELLLRLLPLIEDQRERSSLELMPLGMAPASVENNENESTVSISTAIVSTASQDTADNESKSIDQSNSSDDMDVLARLVARHCSINPRQTIPFDPGSSTNPPGAALHVSAAQDDPSALTLFTSNPNQIALDQALDSQLVAAAKAGDEAEVRRLLADGADARAQNERGETALQIARMGGNEAVIEALLGKGGDTSGLLSYEGKDRWRSYHLDQRALSAYSGM